MVQRHTSSRDAADVQRAALFILLHLLVIRYLHGGAGGGKQMAGQEGGGGRSRVSALRDDAPRLRRPVLQPASHCPGGSPSPPDKAPHQLLTLAWTAARTLTGKSSGFDSYCISCFISSKRTCVQEERAAATVGRSIEPGRSHPASRTSTLHRKQQGRQRRQRRQRHEQQPAHLEVAEPALLNEVRVCKAARFPRYRPCHVILRAQVLHTCVVSE